jgi:RNA polymerase sigma factor (sigma-70 family)
MDQTSVHVQRAIRGARESIDWVVAHFHPWVEAHARLRLGPGTPREDVEDVVSEVWLVTLRRLGELRPQGGRYAPTLVRFLGTTTLQLCNNLLRKRIRRAHLGDRRRQEAASGAAGLDDLEGSETGVVTHAAHDELRQRIHACLARLSPDKRNVLVLRLMEHRSNQEVADVLHLAPNTVAVRYRRALQDLRSQLPGAVYAEVRAIRS